MNEKFRFSIQQYYQGRGCYGEILCMTKDWNDIFVLCQKIIAILGNDRVEDDESVYSRLFSRNDYVSLYKCKLTIRVEIRRILWPRVMLEAHKLSPGFEGDSFARMEAAVQQVIG